MDYFINLDSSPSDSLKQSLTSPFISKNLNDVYVGDKSTVNLYFIDNTRSYVDVSGSTFKVSIGNKSKIPFAGEFELTIDSASSSFAYNATANDISTEFNDAFEVHGQNGTFTVSGSLSLSVNIQNIQPESIGYVVDTDNARLFQIKPKPYSYATGSANVVSGSNVVGFTFQLNLETKEMLQAIPSGYLVCTFEVTKNDEVVLSKDITVKNQLTGDYLSNFSSVLLPEVLTSTEIYALLDSKLDESIYNSFTSSYQVDSGSFNTKIDSKLNTSSFNSFTASYQLDSASFDFRITNNVPIGFVTTSSYQIDSGSFNNKIDSKLNTSSYYSDSSSFSSSLSNKVNNISGVSNIQSISFSDYNNLVAPDSNTLYLIISS